MRIEIDEPDLKPISDAFAADGFQMRVVGGAVRDMLLGLKPKDIDVATDATPIAMLNTARRHSIVTIPTGIRHGTITFVSGSSQYEVTTLREDLETDGRHATVGFVRDFETDAARRDFTINAMSADLNGAVHDYFDGAADLANGVVRFVGDATARMEEDYLRILRFFRFRARFRKPETLDDRDLLEAVRTASEGLQFISGERIWMEMRRILAHENGAREIAVMSATGVLEHIKLSPRAIDISLAARVMRLGGSPTVALGALASAQDDLSVLIDRWKLPNLDAEEVISAANVSKSTASDPHHWLCELADGSDPVVLAPALAARGAHEAAEAVRKGVPAFPLLGRDLIAAGHEAGPNLGVRLRELKQAWKDSGFTLEKDDLIAQSDPAARPGP